MQGLEPELQLITYFQNRADQAASILQKESRSGMEEFHAAFGSKENIVDIIRTLHKHADCECSYETKVHALDAYWHIGQDICFVSSTLDSEIRKCLQSASCLEDAMLVVLEGLSFEEKQWVADMGNEIGTFFDQVIELRNNCAECSIISGLYQVIDVLDSASEGYGAINDSDPASSSVASVPERDNDDEEEDEDEEEA